MSDRTSITFEVTPEMLAEALADLDNTGWARFFNQLGRINERWRSKPGNMGLDMQLCYTVDADQGDGWQLTYSGRLAMEMIGSWAGAVSTPTLDKIAREAMAP